MHSLPASVLTCLERADRVHVEGSNAFARPRTCHVYERACQCVEEGGGYGWVGIQHVFLARRRNPLAS